MCCPTEDNCIFSESLAEVKLQAIVDITIKRLCVVQEQVVKNTVNEGNVILKSLTVIFKWGADGSGEQSRYKQISNEFRFEEANGTVTIIWSH
ncbi:hypothetical protein ILUMI_07810 [Ignelater luminosus]|uniref:Uncharacterized protein n=1 Tax=Ignelater luminosus TaxID=2038154 RepID=A0A8K0GB92_IGNLU|nr:hypothetical protein ILUMI_07810 [Ignelater luminosus]